MLRGCDSAYALPPMLAPMMTPSMMGGPKREFFQQANPVPRGPFPCLASLHAISAQHGSPPIPSTSPASTKPQRQPTDSAVGDDIVTLFPRRKAGQSRPGGGKGPVVLSLELLEQFYGMPLHVAAKRLGICQTAIKKVCRRLGIKKWPYKEMRAPTGDGKGQEGSEGSGSDDGPAEEAERRRQVQDAGGSGVKLEKKGGDAEVEAAVTALLRLHAESAHD